MGLFSKSELKAKYTIGEILGAGRFSKVKLGTNKATNEQFAIKVINSPSPEDIAFAAKEIEILQRLSHPNIVSLVEIFEEGKTEARKKIFLVMELVTGGELLDRIVAQGTLSEARARSIMQDIFRALEYLHERGIVHRDLKPENILFVNDDPNSPVKVADFGLANLYDPQGLQTSLKTMCGTPGYVAPEVLKSRIQNKGYGSQVDMWSCGVILYILLCGFAPFYDADQQHLFRKIVKGDYSFPEPAWTGISEEAKDLVRLCLTVNPQERITASEAMAHAWMTADGAQLSTVCLSTENLARYRRNRSMRRVRNAILAIGRLQRTLAANVTSVAN